MVDNIILFHFKYAKECKEELANILTITKYIKVYLHSYELAAVCT